MEIDEVLENNQSSNASSELRSKMPYTEAVLLEIQRLGNIAPNSLLHATSKTTRIGNYVLPAGTTINSSMLSIMMDPKAFPDPEQFKPERFIDSNNGSFVPHPNVVPFGVGKRRCLGESLAKTELFIFFTGLIEKFEIKLADEKKKPTTQYRPGITLTPHPFKVRFIPRY
jgi:cytochrome P450